MYFYLLFKFHIKKNWNFYIIQGQIVIVKQYEILCILSTSVWVNLHTKLLQYDMLSDVTNENKFLVGIIRIMFTKRGLHTNNYGQVRKSIIKDTV